MLIALPMSLIVGILISLRLKERATSGIFERMMRDPKLLTTIKQLDKATKRWSDK
tara:strand:- start:82005 stop:82169 length:165 start_codon:yes stop_codon:yes gene_type:complete